MTTGSGAMKTIWAALSEAGATVFRNNVALAAVGKITWIKQAGTCRVLPGDAVVRNARVLHAGLFKGSGDLIGWTEVVVTPEMVGKTVAIFTSVEAKDGTGKSSTEQRTWRDNVVKAGGFAGEARCEVDALRIIGLDRVKTNKVIDAIRRVGK